MRYVFSVAKTFFHWLVFKPWNRRTRGSSRIFEYCIHIVKRIYALCTHVRRSLAAFLAAILDRFRFLILLQRRFRDVSLVNGGSLDWKCILYFDFNTHPIHPSVYAIYRLKTVLRNVSREHLHGKNMDTENHRTRAFLFTRHLACVLLCDVRYTQSNMHVNCREHFPCIFTTEILLTWIHAYPYTQILYIFLIMYDSYNSKLYEANLCI